MLKAIANWFHHATDPHCEECNMCMACEVYKNQLMMANAEKKALLELLMNGLERPNNVPIGQLVNTDQTDFIRKSSVPFNVRRQMLEENDREQAKILDQKKREAAAAKLEAELSISVPIQETA